LFVAGSLFGAGSRLRPVACIRSRSADQQRCGHAFHGVLILGSTKLTVKPFGLVGHQSLGFTWNNQDRFSLDQDPSNITRLLLKRAVSLPGKPGPVLTQILASGSRTCWFRPSQPIAREQLDD